MLQRAILSELRAWKKERYRKPLVLRGARQVGKTTIIEHFAREFSHYIKLNLENRDDRNLIGDSFSSTVQALEARFSKQLSAEDTLVFFDEIQASPETVGMLRFFLEKMPQTAVVCAGSLLEQRLSEKKISFPAGRVSYMFMAPMSFEEFLRARKKESLIALLHDNPANLGAPSHELIMAELSAYRYIGGMPAAVREYVETGSLAHVRRVQKDLFQSVLDDIVKYSRESEIKYIETVFDSAPFFIGERIKYGNFNNSEYRSREMKHAFEMLEKAFLVYRSMPTTVTAPPPFNNTSRAPKLFFFDIGLAISRLNPAAIGGRDNSMGGISGPVTEQFVFQEFLSSCTQIPSAPLFWVRENLNANAEIDFMVQYGESLLPVEVKSGTAGSLKSLAVFFGSTSGRRRAVRFYNGLPSRDHSIAAAFGDPYELINLPLYYAGNWKEAIEKMTVP
jgi:predicted AAA+ superfamily ATPase